MSQFEFYKDDDDIPIGLFIRHDNLQTDEYDDDDHAAFVSFVPNDLVQVVTIEVDEPLTIKEPIECFCGYKCTITNGEVNGEASTV